MIQRIQTIWLLLAAITAFLLTRIPLFSGTMAGNVVRNFLATENLLLFAVTAIAGLLAVIAIFLFKNRKFQQKLTTFGILTSILLIALEVWQIGEFKKQNNTLLGSYYWGALLPILMAVFFILASRNIRKDEKLIKSLDRLR